MQEVSSIWVLYLNKQLAEKDKHSWSTKANGN